MSHDTPICDYEGSDYVEFWNGRQYEDSCERIALARLLPPGGARLIDLGAGFGRLEVVELFAARHNHDAAGWHVTNRLT